MTTYVLNIESIPNWKADLAAGFLHLGLSDRRRKFFDTLKPQDVIITYVKATGFVDVREIAEAGISKLGMQGDYPEGAWPWKIKTRLLVSLGLNNAISPNVFPQTKLCSGQWRYRFQQSGKLLDVQDGRTIMKAIMAEAANH